MTQEPFYTKLSDRGLIFIAGPDRLEFLQNLVTNDINKLEPHNSLYACLLNSQGKFLYDFFVIQGSEDEILIDCEGGARAADLFKRLSQYKLRSNVNISVEENVPVYAVLPLMSSRAKPRDLTRGHTGSDPSTSLRSGRDDMVGYADPRHKDMGFRSFEKPKNMSEQPFGFWDAHRIRLCIPDGSRDMTPEVSTMDEAHIEKLNGVSYDKGCYVGQELTARMHYRGLGKKHLYAVEGDLPEPGSEITIDGKSVGEMRSRCGDVGLALLKDENTAALCKAGIKVLKGLQAQDNA